jgi:preprotein translocase subunit SecB
VKNVAEHDDGNVETVRRRARIKRTWRNRSQIKTPTCEATPDYVSWLNLKLARRFMTKKSDQTLGTEENNQSLGIIAQYIKDLSFESATSISQAAPADKQPQIDVQLKIDVKNKEKNVFYVALIIEINAKLEKPLFILELNYTGEFVVDGFPTEMVEPILYVECPRLLFPFARSIIANTVSEGGFPPLYLAPVNFADLYRQQQEAKNQTLQ